MSPKPANKSPVQAQSTSSVTCLTKQWHLVLLALSFLTRIPVNIRFNVNEEMLSQASRYFAFIGALIGSLCALVFFICSQILPVNISILIAMAFSLLLTGAFHEDGWADVWDGFGGGWQVKDKLNIMKDSRVGTYGAAALIMVLLLKYQTLSVLGELQAYYVIYALILAHTVSRVLATSLIIDMPYVREDALTKVKPIAQNLSLQSLVVLGVTGVLILSLGVWSDFFTLVQTFYLVIFLYALRWVIKAWFMRQLGGYTGDCLGAAQQLSEVGIYILLVSWFAPVNSLFNHVITEATL